jgi:cysteine desulfurase
VDRLDLDQMNGVHLSDGVWEAMAPLLRGPTASPQATHHPGLKAREALEAARSEFQRLFGGCGPESIFFTSGGSEAVNLAVKGTAWASEERGRHLVATRAEHPAVMDSLHFLASKGWEVSWVEVDSTGIVEPGKILEQVRADTVLVATHWVSHDLGCVQPAAEIAAALERFGVPLFLDATGCAGWLPGDLSGTGAALVAIDPARNGGPAGAGVLWRDGARRLAPLLHGGVQEHGLRGGLENVAACVGAAAAMRQISAGDDPAAARLGAIQMDLLGRLRAEIPHARLNGPEPGPRRSPTHLSFCAEGVEAEAVALRLDLQGLAVGSRTGCLARNARVPAPLEAVGVPEELALAALLLSWRGELSPSELERAARLISKAVSFLREMSPAWEDKGLGISPFRTPSRW